MTQDDHSVCSPSVRHENRLRLATVCARGSRPFLCCYENRFRLSATYVPGSSSILFCLYLMAETLDFIFVIELLKTEDDLFSLLTFSSTRESTSPRDGIRSRSKIIFYSVIHFNSQRHEIFFVNEFVHDSRQSILPSFVHLYMIARDFLRHWIMFMIQDHLFCFILWGHKNYLCLHASLAQGSRSVPFCLSLSIVISIFVMSIFVQDSSFDNYILIQLYPWWGGLLHGSQPKWRRRLSLHSETSRQAHWVARSDFRDSAPSSRLGGWGGHSDYVVTNLLC